MFYVWGFYVIDDVIHSQSLVLLKLKCNAKSASEYGFAYFLFIKDCKIFPDSGISERRSEVCLFACTSIVAKL